MKPPICPFAFSFIFAFAFSLSLALWLAAAPAAAYVGPGPGLSMLGSFFTLLAGIVFAFFMVLLYPIRLLIKKHKARKNSDNPPPAG